MKFILLIISAVICVTQCYKILMVFPVPSRSHYILGNTLGRGLAKAGHDVFMLSPYEDKNAPKNYKNVVLTGLDEIRKGNGTFNPIDFGALHPWIVITSMNTIGKGIVEFTFGHSNFKNLLGEKFDVIILEQFKNDAMKVLQCHFEAPLIVFSTVGANTWINLDAANPSPPSYIPNIFTSYSSNMTLFQRIFNSLTTLVEVFNIYFLFLPSQKELAIQHFPKCSDNDLLLSNISLFLLNSHESSNQPVPLVPNMVSIGGFHVKPPNALPKDLKEFMDNAKEGVVYFSMGSNVQCSLISDGIKNALVKVLGKLKQKVLWKCDIDLPGKPDNVKFATWFPQSDILAHPNMKLFITHGGLLSILETIHHGVPMLTLPVFAEQRMNAAGAEASGYALKIPFIEITEENFSEALNKLLTDTKYQENIKLRSILLHDRPIKPLDLAIYWTEFIARHKGAPHLRVAAVNLTWYQHLLLDVILLVGLVIIISFAVLYFTCKKVWSCRKNKEKKE